MLFSMPLINDSHIVTSWKEKNEKISTKSVCYTYKEGTIDKWLCRKKAVREFKEKCKNTKTKKYCIASRNTTVVR